MVCHFDQGRRQSFRIHLQQPVRSHCRRHRHLGQNYHRQILLQQPARNQSTAIARTAVTATTRSPTKAKVISAIRVIAASTSTASSLSTTGTAGTLTAWCALAFWSKFRLVKETAITKSQSTVAGTLATVLFARTARSNARPSRAGAVTSPNGGRLGSKRRAFVGITFWRVRGSRKLDSAAAAIAVTGD